MSDHSPDTTKMVPEQRAAAMQHLVDVHRRLTKPHVMEVVHQNEHSSYRRMVVDGKPDREDTA